MALQSKNKKTSHSIDQTTLKVVCDQLCDNIEDLFNYFGIEYRNNGKFYSMCCPVHGGDNPSALNIYHIGDSYRGNWKCRTHQCEKIFKGSGPSRRMPKVSKSKYQLGLIKMDEKKKDAVAAIQIQLKVFKSPWIFRRPWFRG